MSSKRLALFTLLITTFVACSSAPVITNTTSCDSIPEGALRLIEAYPDHIVDYKDNMIVFSDGSQMIYDDGKKRTIDQMHLEQDIEEIFYQDYDKGVYPPPYGYDPGRYRCAAFFGKIYGNTREEVVKNLVVVDWCPRHGGKPVLFTSVAGAAEALKRVSDELDQHPELKEWVLNAQTFNWRTIQGMTRLSPHGYGIAIDLEAHRSHYWKWTYPRAKEHAQMKYHNTFNMKVVEIFERHGFIWGGRWYHFDTMHFEYRPEMNMPEYMVGVSKPKVITAKTPEPKLEREFYYRVFKEDKKCSSEEQLRAEFYSRVFRTTYHE